MLSDINAGAIRRVNPDRGTKNCVNCVVATDALLAGRPASALPGGPYEIDVLERIFGAKFNDGGDIKILAEETQTIEFGWVFFYNSSNFVRTGDIRFALAGNGPLLVMKDGQISCLPTAIPWEEVVGKMARPASGRAV